MCFSAEASFGAGAVIAVVGAFAMQKASTASQGGLAAIPLFFAIQQCLEGMLWITIHHLEYLLWQQIGTYGFLLFAWVVWPVYIPFAIRLLEKDPRRRKWLALLIGVGSFVSLCFAYILIFHHAEASIAGNHITYTQDFRYDEPFSWITSAFYFIPIALSPFVSSIKKIWFLGITIITSFIITKIYFQDHLISIWCFFAAIMSILVLWIIRKLRKVPHGKDYDLAKAY
ncbi:hypothetical protein OKW21_002345 [Catalinimonas alkaloidigena]|uniref:DUF6629 family protein n=1 Tax=Catalinimonas alkaloidigena TaxID=1075417 RepID=UPI0024070BA4|nr:DUF6629 family protein [Catalinimonas alkaloidigena]MDF9797082.1 hypothetical protein [Catalinimonas alkaloidigena]